MANAPFANLPKPGDLLRLPNVPRRARRVLVWGLRSLGTIVALALFAIFALVLGITSAWYAVHTGLQFNTERSGPWVLWTYAGISEDDPYSRARFVALNTVTLPGERVLRYEARTDSAGLRLHSSCNYEIASPPLNSEWWTLAVFDARGNLVANAAERYGFNRGSVARDGRGHFRITLSRDAQPENWLPTGAAGRMVIVLEVVEPESAQSSSSDQLFVPPAIRRLSC